jgi:hypothetical protein
MTPKLSNPAYNQNSNRNGKHSSRHGVRSLGLLALGICSVLALPSAAQAQDTEATAPAAPVILPQYSSITSTDGTIQVSRLPVTYNGKTYYVDLTLALKAEVSTKGVVTIASTATTVPSPPLIVDNFKAGTYVGPSTVLGGKAIIVVSGPSPLPNGGTAWTLASAPDSNGDTYPDTAVWYVESIANNPLASRIDAAKITSPDYAYGVGSGGLWCNDALLGFSQVGNTLSISDFSNCYDFETPVDTITYTLQQ